MMGGDGLTHATQVAILGANYIAARLREHYPVLYTGHDGVVAHECILDLRDLTKRTGSTSTTSPSGSSTTASTRRRCRSPWRAR